MVTGDAHDPLRNQQATRLARQNALDGPFGNADLPRERCVRLPGLAQIRAQQHAVRNIGFRPVRQDRIVE